MHDLGFLPEGEMIERSRGTTSYDLVRQRSFSIKKVLQTAEIAASAEAESLPLLIKRLDDKEPCVRFWAATGCAILGTRAKSAVHILKNRLNDESADVSIAAAEALCVLNEQDKGLPVLASFLQDNNPRIALRAANALEALDQKAVGALPALQELVDKTENVDLQKATSWTISRLKNKQNK
jgi:HEAT repeat protein